MFNALSFNFEVYKFFILIEVFLYSSSVLMFTTSLIQSYAFQID